MKRKPPPDKGLKAPVKKFEDTFSGEATVYDWLKEQGATEHLKFDEDTGKPVRVFKIKL